MDKQRLILALLFTSIMYFSSCTVLHISHTIPCTIDKELLFQKLIRQLRKDRFQIETVDAKNGYLFAKTKENISIEFGFTKQYNAWDISIEDGKIYAVYLIVYVKYNAFGHVEYEKERAIGQLKDYEKKYWNTYKILEKTCDNEIELIIEKLN